MLKDAFPEVPLGAWVQATVTVTEDIDGLRIVHAERGAIGQVVSKLPGLWPSIYWESTGTRVECDPEEFTLLELPIPSLPQRIRGGLKQ